MIGVSTSPQPPIPSPLFKNMLAIAEKTLTIQEVLSWAEDYLAQYDVPDAKAEAEYLLAHALDCKRSGLYLNFNQAVDSYELQRFVGFVERRIKREPSQYIIGEQEFWGLAFKVTPDVLIPRPETELLVEETLRIARGMWDVGCGKASSKDIFTPPTSHPLPRIILDLCTGSGCIAASLAKEIPKCKVYATDVSEKALSVARENAERHGVADKIHFLQGNLFEPFKAMGIKFDMIVSNPPYISKRVLHELQPEVKDYEPRTALYGGEDGLDFYRRIISGSPAYLSAGGYLMLEMGYGQAEEIKELMEQNKAFEHIVIKKDLAGIERIIKAQIKG